MAASVVKEASWIARWVALISELICVRSPSRSVARVRDAASEPVSPLYSRVTSSSWAFSSTTWSW